MKQIILILQWIIQYVLQIVANIYLFDFLHWNTLHKSSEISQLLIFTAFYVDTYLVKLLFHYKLNKNKKEKKHFLKWFIYKNIVIDTNNNYSLTCLYQYIELYFILQPIYCNVFFHGNFLQCSAVLWPQQRIALAYTSISNSNEKITSTTFFSLKKIYFRKRNCKTNLENHFLVFLKDLKFIHKNINFK